MDDKETVYQEKLNRYLTAIDVGKPDKVPIRLFLCEFMAKYAGFTLDEVYYDLGKNILAVNKTIEDFDLDVISSTPSLWWASTHDAVGAKYLKFPGWDIKENSQFQYVEEEYMMPEDYDEFIADPTKWILNVYLQRIHEEYANPGSYRANLALIKGAASMVISSNANQQAITRWAKEFGVPVMSSGFVKAPFDTLGDTLRGLKGIMMDLLRRPDKILAAMKVLVAHNIYYAMATAGGDTLLPVFFPLHRGSFPFLNPKQWETFYWPSLKAVIEGLWALEKKSLLYAEGNWTPYLERFAELPAKSIVFHVDQTDLGKAKEILGGRFCLSGNVPNTLMSYGKPEEVCEYCKRLLDQYAADGGFIIDLAGIAQTDLKVENVVALVETTRKYGVY